MVSCSRLFVCPLPWAASSAGQPVPSGHTYISNISDELKRWFTARWERRSSLYQPRDLPFAWLRLHSIVSYSIVWWMQAAQAFRFEHGMPAMRNTNTSGDAGQEKSAQDTSATMLTNYGFNGLRCWFGFENTRFFNASGLVHQQQQEN